MSTQTAITRRVGGARRRRNTGGIGAASLSAAAGLAAVLCVCGSAAAAPVRFENPAGPGRFEWEPAVHGTNVVLNVTLPASTQTSLISQPGSIRQSWALDTTEVSVGATTASLNRVEYVTVATTRRYLSPAALGDLIPRVAPVQFQTTGNIHFHSTLAGDPEYLIPEGESVYAGVRFTLPDGDHYGWIGIVRTGNFVDAFAWGYETSPNTPIAAGAANIPAPGTLAALAFGALAAARRPKRRGCGMSDVGCRM